jgi:hypothetical protein
MTKIVAFLQNAWFRDPRRAKQIYDRNPASREQLNAQFLFMGSLTGRRLQGAFGPDMCNQIVWENISEEFGGYSSSSFPANRQHIKSVIEKHAPDIILTFGEPAKAALQAWQHEEVQRREVAPIPLIIHGPHPAARYAEVRQELWEMSEELTFKQHDVFGVDVWGRYDYSRKHYEPSESIGV